MNPTEQKVVQIVPPQLKDNGAFAGNTYFDTMGMVDATVEVFVGATDAIVGSTDTSTPLYLEECETSGGSYTKVTGSDLSAVIGANDDGKNYRIFIDLKNKAHKRYMRLNAPTAADATGANLCAVARLTPQNSLATAALKGLAEEIFV